MPKRDPFDGADYSRKEKYARRTFTRAHRACELPPKRTGKLEPGPVPAEPFIDLGRSVQCIPGHAVIGGTHLSRLPASSSGRRGGR